MEQHLDLTITLTGTLSNKTINQYSLWTRFSFFFQGNEEYLNIINKSNITIHGTVYKDDKTNKLENVPKYVINHGILNGEDLHKLLRRAKVSSRGYKTFSRSA